MNNTTEKERVLARIELGVLITRVRGKHAREKLLRWMPGIDLQCLTDIEEARITRTRDEYTRVLEGFRHLGLLRRMDVRKARVHLGRIHPPVPEKLARHSLLRNHVVRISTSVRSAFGRA